MQRSVEARKERFDAHSRMLGQTAEAGVIQLYIKQEEANQQILQKALDENRARYVGIAAAW